MTARRGSLLTLLAGLLAATAIAAPAATALVPPPIIPAPAWAPIAVSGPTNLPPGGEGTIAVYTQNVGGITSLGTITVKDHLPAGLVTSKTPESEGNAWNCSTGAGQSTVTCTTTETVGPGLAPKAIKIPVSVGAAPGQVVNSVTASGAGAKVAGSYEGPITISSTPAKAGAQAFTGATHNADGTLATQAGSHPYVTTSAVFVNTVLSPKGEIVPAGDPKTIEVAIPPGFLGNPTATPRCTEGLSDAKCPIESQVGLAQPLFSHFGGNGDPDAVHAVEAPIGYPAKFTFSLGGAFAQVNVIGTLRSDEDYGVSLGSPNTPQIEAVFGSFFSFWGAPADHTHDGQRCQIVKSQSGCGPSTADNTAFVTLASDCALQAVQPPAARLFLDTWLTPGQFEPIDAPIPPVVGCDQLQFEASFAFQPEKHTGATPSAFSNRLVLPQKGLIEPTLLATPPPKEVTITLPAGVTLNAAAADGLQTCSLAQIGYKGNGFKAPNRIRFDKKSVKCPEASRIGAVKVQTELLDNPLRGSLYLAAEHENPFGSLLAAYLVIEDPSVGVIVKLPARIESDPVSGQLTAFFDDLPQLAFGELELKLKGGERAPLATPDICGEARTLGLFTPWSAPESGPPTETEDSFETNVGPGGAPCAPSKGARPFAPAFSAASVSSSAGVYTPLELQLNRRDGEQELKGVQITLPRGLTGKIAGIATCLPAQIAAAEAKTGKAEQADSSCPASSQLGTVVSGAGVGSAPIYVRGKVFLAGPYKGAPLSVVTVVPAVAGPYDLGTVVTRAATYVDPSSAQLTAVTDPIPDILQGIPLQLRSIRIALDRPGFSLNPTNCRKLSIGARLTGAGGDTASASDDVTATSLVPFQVGGCKSLAFKPRLRASLSGGTGRNAHPSLRTTFTAPRGANFANTSFVQVALPHSEFLDQGHIDTVCTRPQFAAKICPKGSIYGYAKAKTPLLDEPLEGPVYLRSSDNKLPDLAIALRGPESRPLEAIVNGRIDSIHGGIRTTFESLPDVPLRKVSVTFKGGGKGLLVNSRNLCKAERKARMTVRVVGQNGKRADHFPVLGDDCGKKGKKQGKKRAQR